MWKCSTDLYMTEVGGLVFKKNGIYEQDDNTSRFILIDENGDDHQIFGDWLQYFAKQ